MTKKINSRARIGQIELVDVAEADDPLAELLALGGDSAERYVVKRLQPYDKAGTLLNAVSREELPHLQARLIDQFGPGKYEVFALDASSRYLPGRHAIVTISPDAIRSDGTLASSPRSPIASPAAASTPAADPAMPAWLREMEARNERLRLEAREDRRAWLVPLLGALTPAVPKLLESLFGRAPTFAEQIQALGGLKQLTGGGDNGDGKIDALLQGIELASQLRGDAPAGGPGGWVGEALQIARGLINRQGQPQQPAALPAPAEPAAASAPAATAAPAPAAPPLPTLPPPFDRYAANLVELARDLETYARNNTEPQIATAALLNKLPDGIDQDFPPAVIKSLVAREDWWQQLVTFRPGLAGQHKYCAQLRATLLQWLEQLPAELGAGEETTGSEAT